MWVLYTAIIKHSRLLLLLLLSNAPYLSPWLLMQTLYIQYLHVTQLESYQMSQRHLCNTCVQAASNLKKDLVTRYRRLVYSNMYTMCTYLDVPQTGDGTMIH